MQRRCEKVTSPSRSSLAYHCKITTHCDPISDLFSLAFILIKPHDLSSPMTTVDIPWTKLPRTLDPVCKSGCPTTIFKNLSNPALRVSIFASSKRPRNIFPGRGGIVTRALSRSSRSRKTSKSEYLRSTSDFRSLKAGMLVQIRMW